MSIRLRTLTRKSTLGFGKYKLYTVDTMLKTSFKMRQALIASYYKLESISYNDNVLEALEITDEFRIEKPSTDLEMYQTFISQLTGYDYKKLGHKNAKALNNMANFGKRKLEVQSKRKLQNINHK